jgi:hypothetical protein
LPKQQLSELSDMLWPVTSTAQTWGIVFATLGAAFLGAIVAYVGARHQAKEQAKSDDGRNGCVISQVP